MFTTKFFSDKRNKRNTLDVVRVKRASLLKGPVLRNNRNQAGRLRTTTEWCRSAYCAHKKVKSVVDLMDEETW